ncbi:inositol phosphorylceramide synthase [Nocardia beijingensis]|uniref:phosphatase PAP2 family protein n=1 Tax=Nocardia beijingensis TaxID=95162 RepID=UPI001894C9AD|nr:phosphatase PAP2 family protein [Nocardia beijingensis]MBF6464626.1 inositol phosphorylceramide synthase [Nocardia beijingensis]
MLVEYPGSEVGSAVSRRRAPRTRVAVVAAVAAVPVLLIVLQGVAIWQGFEGPLESLGRDYIGTPKSMSVPWAGLVLALVGISTRRRLVAVGVAAAIDVVWAGVRLVAGAPFAIGNGPVIVLTGLALVAWLRWSGAERRDALHAAALGSLLMLATKVGDVWLHVTVIGRPTVLDEYVILADHALGDPSWVLGRAVDAMGPVVYAVLHWVYIELPVAAIVVAVWQLRRVASSGRWPSHYLVRTFLVLGLVGPVVYVLFPVVGPMFAFGPDGNGLQLGNYWPGVVPPIDRNPMPLPFDAPVPRNCMPSMHTAWALSVFLHTRRDSDGEPAPGWLRWGGAFWLLATLAATLGFGYHYGVDLVAGAVLCLTVESALREPERGWGWFRIRLVGSGAVVLAALLLSYRYLAVPMAEYPVLAGTVVLGLLAGLAAAFHATWFAAARQPLRAEREVEPAAR